MNVELLTMEKDQAKTMLREYRRELAREHSAELAAVEKGLQAIARGRRVLHLAQAIESGGFDEQGRPNIAVARSDRTRVRLSMPPGGAWLRYTTHEWSGRRFGRMPANDATTINLVGGPGRREGWEEWDAMVPLVPPAALRESGLKSRGALGRCMTLFEVEEWQARDRRPATNGDPYLLRRIGGELYEILAEWDLTPLERAIMQGRR